MILVTGATGANGRELLRMLSERGLAARAMVREPAKATGLSGIPGVEVVQGDFDDAESLERAAAGCDRTFLTTNSSERVEAQQRAFVAAATRAGVGNIVYLSQFAAEADSPIRFLRYHAAIEEAIAASGLSYTFLRPNLYMQSIPMLASGLRESGTFSAPAGNAAVSIIDVCDIAAVAAQALADNARGGRTYTLTGPAALTFAEIAQTLARVLERPVRYVDVPPDTMRDALSQAGMPAWQADGLVEDFAHYARGEAAEVTSDVEAVTGREARSFATFVAENRDLFA